MGCGASSSTATSTATGTDTKAPIKMSLKPLTGLISDVVVQLPAEDVQKSSGFALDIGSTIGKIIYRSNKEYKDGQPIKPQDDATKGQVHFAMFPQSDIKGMVDYIKQNCDLKANDEGEILIYSSGVGGASFRKDIEGGLNCKLDIIPEFDCFCKAFVALEKVLPEEELFIPPSAKLQAEIAEFKAKMEGVMENMAAMIETKMGTDVGEEVKEEDRPRLLVMGGSASGVMQINSDGTFTMLDGIGTAGRFMYGLSTILSGENDFKKLEKMVSESDGKTADTWLSDLRVDTPQDGEADNIYDVGNDMGDFYLFPFGKGISHPADQMKKGDLVWSVFNTTAFIHAQMVCTNARYTKAKTVYFCGNVFNTQVMRDMISRATNQNTIELPSSNHFDYHFLNNGGMYGAMGAFLHVKKAEAAE